MMPPARVTPRRKRPRVQARTVAGLLVLALLIGWHGFSPYGLAAIIIGTPAQYAIGFAIGVPGWLFLTGMIRSNRH